MSFRAKLLLLGYIVLTISEPIGESKCDVIGGFGGKTTVVCPNINELQKIKTLDQVAYVRITNCSNSTDLDNITMDHVQNLVYDCTLTQMPSYVFSSFPNLKRVGFPKCNISRLLWQSVFNFKSSKVSLTNCPITCDCNHEWLASRELSYVERPDSFSSPLCKPDCPKHSISTNETEYYVNAGDNITIDVHVQDKFINITRDRKYFEWHQYFMHVHEEVITENKFTLKLENITVFDLGEIVAICWHCVNFQQIKIKVIVFRPIEMSFDANEHYDSDILSVIGWPIKNLTLKLTHVSSNKSETHSMDGEASRFFFDSLVVDPQESKQSFIRKFRISLNAHANGDHITGLVRFEMCINGKNCQTIERELWYLGLPISSTPLSPPLPPVVKNVPSSWTSTTYIVVSISIIMLCLLVSFLFANNRYRIRKYFYHRVSNSNRNENEINPTEYEMRRSSGGTEETSVERDSLASDYTNQIIEFIDIGKIEIHEIIGKGAFGQVYKGSWQKLGPNTIAIKTINQVNQTIEQEAAVLFRLNHKNIVRLHGMTKKDNTLLLVLELMNLGELRKYLQERRPAINGSYSQFPPPLTAEELRKIIIDIVEGLAYLHTQQVIHRDLAARNCLVSGKSDLRTITASQRPPIVVKISDFGMSKQLLNSDYYVMNTKGLLPIRWMPPEAVITQKFSLQTDVWALGVTMWEVLNYGELPFGNVETDFLIATAMSGKTPEQTSFCSDKMYALMSRCWTKDPEERIAVEDIRLDPELHTEYANGGASH